MAVVKVKEQFQQRRSTFRNGVMTHIRQWHVWCDDINDGTVVALTGVPPAGTTHPKDGSAKLTGLEATPNNNHHLMFVILGEYTSSNSVGIPVNPLERPPTISYGSNEFTEPYFLDKTTPTPKPVVNSASEHFESSTERENGELVMTIVTNEATFDVLAIEQLKHTTNNAPIWIDQLEFDTGTCKLSAPTAQKVTENVEGQGGVIEPFAYYVVTWTVKARKDGWDDQIIDAGFNELVPNGDPTKPALLRAIYDSNQANATTPWPLNGHGRKLAKPISVDDVKIFQPVTLTFKPYGKADWSGYKAFQPASWGVEQEE